MIIGNQWSANRNMRAAEAITEWFLSPEGQTVMTAGWMRSVRANFRRLPHGARPTTEILSNATVIRSVPGDREEILNSFQERLTGVIQVETNETVETVDTHE